MATELNANSPGVSRRALLRRGLTALGVVSIAPALSACEVPFLSSGTEPFEMPVETPEEAITRLLEGNARFVRGKSTKCQRALTSGGTTACCWCYSLGRAVDWRFHG